MQIIFSIKNEKPTFGAGMTPKIVNEIHTANIQEISDRLLQNGVPNNFQDNNVIAWCSNKVVEIIQELNKKFGFRFELPKGIFVEDFARLNIDDSTCRGFCNLRPTFLKKSTEEIIPSRTIFFNNFETAKKELPPEYMWIMNWQNINEIADLHFLTKKSSTPNFLYTFLHEISHVLHENELLKKFGGVKLAEKLETLETTRQLEVHQKKYGHQLSEICDYATTNPLEAVACDIPKRIVMKLDTNLNITHNPFTQTPYEKQSLFSYFRKIFEEKESLTLDEILYNFWNGKFN